mmetsp:Transcript_57031/g.79103  ORF Transcript_57031/g.79103 Transcript_57031/m.79103 type:complete len:176 (-) Transcript_57031:8-535(-)
MAAKGVRLADSGSVTKSRSVDMQSVFNTYDTERTGKIDQTQAVKAMRAMGHVLGKKQADDLELTLLLDYDSECDFAQFSKLVNELEGTNVTKRDLGAAVRAIDDDHDGRIDKGELTRLMAHVGEPLDEEELEEFFKHAPHVNASTIAINSFVKKMAGRTTRRLSLFADPRREQEA